MLLCQAQAGPPAIHHETHECRIVNALRSNRKANFSQIKDVTSATSLHVVRCIAKNHGYHKLIARHKPFIDSKNQKKRVKWATKNKDRERKRVILTDEASLEIGEDSRRTNITRRPGEEFLEDTLVPTFRSGRKSLMVLGRDSPWGQMAIIEVTFTAF